MNEHVASNTVEIPRPPPNLIYYPRVVRFCEIPGASTRASVSGQAGRGHLTRLSAGNPVVATTPSPGTYWGNTARPYLVPAQVFNETLPHSFGLA